MCVCDRENRKKKSTHWPRRGIEPRSIIYRMNALPVCQRAQYHVLDGRSSRTRTGSLVVPNNICSLSPTSKSGRSDPPFSLFTPYTNHILSCTNCFTLFEPMDQVYFLNAMSVLVTDFGRRLYDTVIIVT